MFLDVKLRTDLEELSSKQSPITKDLSITGNVSMLRLVDGDIYLRRWYGAGLVRLERSTIVTLGAVDGPEEAIDAGISRSLPNSTNPDVIRR